jgi:hypothetical protein
MLGWEIIICRQPDGDTSPATMQSARGNTIAAWTTSLGGLNWLDPLVKAGRVIELGGNGYPLRFTGTAEDLIPRLFQQPPEVLVGTMHLCEALSALGDRCHEMTATELIEAPECRVGEWLLIEAWDQS